MHLPFIFSSAIFISILDLVCGAAFPANVSTTGLQTSACSKAVPTTVYITITIESILPTTSFTGASAITFITLSANSATQPIANTTAIVSTTFKTITATTFKISTTAASKISTATVSKTSTITTVSGLTNKSVFFHYMVGTITDAHCEQDILDAQKLGIDAFALNIDTVTQSWATNTVASLFKWANIHSFKLFFSFDMTGFGNPSQFIDFLSTYATNPAHYKYNGLPFVSTFNGGAGQYTFGQGSVSDGWKVALQQTMANKGIPIYFIPAFQDVQPSGFFQTFPNVDGAFNWDSWAFQSQGQIAVPTDGDMTYLTGAHTAGKTFMMGVSPLQFKHMDGRNNWYRRGEQNLELRFNQVLTLQPDFVELQTWNDAGESHYMGNSWPEPLSGSNIGTYTDDFDHTGYWQILPAFIQAYKTGAKSTSTMYPTNSQTAQGVFWHHTLLAGAGCNNDGLGKPEGIDLVEDLVTVVVLVAAGTTNLQVDVKSGDTHLGISTLVPGYNSYAVGGLTTGIVTVTITSAAGEVLLQASGQIPVASSSNLCNYNFQVVGL